MTPRREFIALNQAIAECMAAAPAEVLATIYSRHPDNRVSGWVLDRDDWFSLLSNQWARLPALWPYSGSLRDTLRVAGPQQYTQMMTPEERALLASKADGIDVYRGCERGSVGVSWTTELDVADRFARATRPLAAPPVILHNRVAKDRCALKMREGYIEIIAVPLGESLVLPVPELAD
jgi:hypothetical protein